MGREWDLATMTDEKTVREIDEWLDYDFRFWIGLNDLNQEGLWEWFNGKPV
jgi:hypothetical protein